MTSSRIQAAIALVLMVCAVVGAYAWRPTVHLADLRAKIELETLFPKAFGDWRVDERMPVQLVSPDTLAMLNKIYNQTLSRTYVNAKGDRIMLSVAYGGDQSDGTRAHRPEVCYPAQGFQIISGQDGLVRLPDQSLRVRQLVAKGGGRIEPVTYWVMVGDHTALSGTEQKLAQLRYTTAGVVPDGMLVRISSIAREVDAEYRVHDQFAADLYTAMPEPVRDRVFGK